MTNRLGNLVKLAKRPAPPVGTTPSRVVHHENKWRLLRYEPRPEGIAYRTPILLVPSLINRHYVLDLLPGKSFAQWFVAQGFDVFAIDWGTPSDEDRFVTFDDVCDTALGRAIRLTAGFGADDRAHVLGYCLGGTLATIHAAAHPEHIASLTLLAAPVRFADDGLLARWSRTKSFDVKVTVDAFGLVPWQLLQSAFQLLRPTLSASKLVHVLDRAWDDESMDGFLALEAWGNDNVSFPGACYERYLTALYREDQLWKGSFALSGIPARLEAITAPLHVLTFEHDAIVPHASAACVLEKAASEDKVHVHLPGGHVGAVVSKSASTRLWPQLARFWAERDARTPRTALRKPAPVVPAEVAAAPAKVPAPKRATRTQRNTR